MSKLMTTIVIMSLFGSAYALSIGAGATYEGLLGEENVDPDPWFGARADVYFKMLPFLGARFGFVDVNMPEDNTNYTFGIHTGADLMFFIPIEGAPIDPYLLLGFTYGSPGEDMSMIDFTGGAGLDFFFNPQFGLYVEAAFDYFSYDFGGGIESDGNFLNVGGGLKVKVPMP